MDKKKPHYSLARIKELINKGDYRISRSALYNAFECFALQQQDIILIVLAVKSENFYKSMTAYDDNTIWQDVYHIKVCDNRKAYLKTQIIDDKTIIISFKEK